MGRTIPLRQAAAEFGVTAKPRSPDRQALADLAAQVAEIDREAAELTAPQRQADEARAALPGAEEALKDALLDQALGDGDASALESLKARVRELRAASRGVDHSGRLAELNAQRIAVAEARTAAVDRAVMVEIDALTVQYHAAAKVALAAEAALAGLEAWAWSHPEAHLRSPMATMIQTKRNPADAFAASTVAFTEAKTVLAEHRDAYRALADRLSADPDATGPDAAGVVQRLPLRPEEIAAQGSNASAQAAA